MKKPWIIVIVLLIIVVVYLGLKNQSATDNKMKKETVKIGVSQITSHAVFDEIIKGIKSGFEAGGYKEGENITYDFQNAQGDNTINQSIAQKFANSDYNLFMPLGTPASQALVNLIKDKPVVFGAVTDPVTAGLVQSNETPGGNVTGTSDITLYNEHLKLLKELVPKAKKVGIVYNPGEANARFALEQTQKYAKDYGLEIITAPANNSGEILSAAKSIAGKVDALYMLPDNTILSGQEAYIKVALDSKKPLITIDQSGVEKGGLATLGTNYKKVGERTAEIAIRVLKGEKPSDIPVLGVTDADLFINTKTAQAIGITIPEEKITMAKQVYQ